MIANLFLLDVSNIEIVVLDMSPHYCCYVVLQCVCEW